MTFLPEITTATAIGLVVYHHVGYPLLLRALPERSVRDDAQPKRRFQIQPSDTGLPTITVLIPAYNEARVIAAKIMNVLSLDYPADRLFLRVACDGCDDDTADAARRAVAFDPEALARVTVVDCMENRGKVAVLNEQIPRCDTDLVALTDASSIVAIDAVLRAAARFEEPDVAVVSGGYALLSPGTDGEAAYWAYQSRVRAAEARLGGVIGAHGAFYVLRRTAFEPLRADTINDDFVLPMEAVGRGWRAVHDDGIAAFELDGTSIEADWRRRLRIGAGNLQQSLRLIGLLSPRHGGTALAFFSGKFLRAFMPYLTLLALVGSLSLAGTHWTWFVASAGQVAGYGLAALVAAAPGLPWPRAARAVSYLVWGHTANGLGGLAYLAGRHRRPWRRVAA